MGAGRRRGTVGLALFAVVSSLLHALALSPVEAAVLPAQRPSATCHVTDGAFTPCPDGRTEWSDITPVAYPQHQAFLYQDQADLDPIRHIPGGTVDTRMLLYEDCTRTTALAPDEWSARPPSPAPPASAPSYASCSAGPRS